MTDDLTAAVLKNLLLRYSEWLDGEGLVMSDKVEHLVLQSATPVRTQIDTRTHEQLVLDFWEAMVANQ